MRYRIFGVEQPFVHVDVDDLRAIFDLLARDLDRRGIIVGEDQLLERRGACDVGALADVDEGGGGGGGHVFLFQFGLSLSKPCPSYPSLDRKSTRLNSSN